MPREKAVKDVPVRSAAVTAEKPAEVQPAPAPKAGPIRVKALSLGFYGNLRRRPGTIFTIASEKEFSSRWMAKLVKQAAPEVEVEADA